MHSHLKTSAVAAIAALAATASAITGPGDFCYGPYFSMYNKGGPSLSYQRLDPALNPGGESAHLHSFDGGNNLAATVGTDSLTASTCTTARMKQDKSLYWNPTLHFKNDTGFYRVPEIYKKVYYKFGDNDVNYGPSTFPKDFKMIAGSSMARSKADSVADAGVTWACLQDGGRIDPKGPFPTGFTSCSDGFATQLSFPDCWNGDAINPEKPDAHMAYSNPYASGTGVEKCPAGFQKARFPTIFIEFWWDIKIFEGSFGSDDMPWVLSNGDPTGFGFHADFAMGWEDGVLEKAIAKDGLQCGCGCGNDEFNAFFGEENVNQNDNYECAATPVYPGGDVEFMKELPGCNPLQYGPAKATAVTGAGCTAAYSGAPVASSSKASSSAAISSAVSSTAVDAASASMSKATSVAAAEASYSAASSAFSLSLPGKGVSDAATTAAAYSTGSASFVFLSEASSVVASDTTVAAGEASAATTSSPDAASMPETPYSATSVRGAISSPASAVEAVSSAMSVGEAMSSATSVGEAMSSATSVGEAMSSATSVVEAVSSAASFPSSPSEGGCKVPVYVTVTPTVYVTAGASDCAGTVYTTITNTATVTVMPSAGGYKHRRHLDAHLHHHKH